MATSLTDAQVQALADDIQASPDLSEMLGRGAINEIRLAYNEQASPDFYVFKESVSTDEARDALVWSEILAQGSKLGAEERWAFDILIWNGTFNPALENTRVGFQRIFASHPQTRDSLLGIARQLATRAEKRFAVDGTGPGGGNGTAPTAVAVRTFAGNLSLDDVTAAVDLIP